MLAALSLYPGSRLSAQTLDDAAMMPARTLCAGVSFTDDRWEKYWEGELKQANGNVGTVTTRNVMFMGSYGLTSRLNLIAMLPYVWTRASQGTLASMNGLQDLTLGVKFRVFEDKLGEVGTLRGFAAVSGALPVSDYTPDFLPLSIGLGSRRAAARLTLNFETKQGFFLHATAARTWRDNVQLNRVSYFTAGELFLSDEVDMHDVMDYGVSLGYHSGRVHVPLSFTRQSTHGGGDIRRWDAPFLSHRMNASRLEASAQYTLPTRARLAARVGASYTVDGRNVGQSTALTAALLYTFSF